MPSSKQKRASKARPSRTTNTNLILEQQLQSQLDLPRRAEIARRKARALNGADRLAGCGQHRIAKVWMIKEVKDFAAKLEVKPLVDSSVLG